VGGGSSRFHATPTPHLTDYFKLPIGAVVEIGREISI
jgi:hypothetical protein